MRVLKLLVLLLLVCPAVAFGQGGEPLKVLFIGNSYTNYHNLPEIVAQMAHAKGRRLFYEMIVPGGRNFERHWKEGKALSAISQKDWDIVMFQNQSFEPVGDPENMYDYGKRFAEAVAETDAQLYFYLTWAYANEGAFKKRKPKEGIQFKDMQDRLNQSYFGLAAEVGGKVSPVGIAWGIVRREHPDMALHMGDGSHPNQRGAYLSGLVMYAVLFDAPPETMPETLYPYFHEWGKSLWGQELKVTTEERKILEAAAKRAIQVANEKMHTLIE